METNKKNSLEKYAPILDKYKEIPSLQKVYSGNSSLEKEIGDFYGIHPRWSIAGRIPRLEAHFEKTWEKGNEETNSKLLDLVSNFSPETIDYSKLSYEQVREDYKSGKKWTLKQWGALGLNLGSLLGGAIGFWGSIIIAQSDKPEYLAVSIPFTVASYYVLVKTAFKGMPPNPADKGGYDEFLKIWTASKRADSFIKKKYQTYLETKRLIQND